MKEYGALDLRNMGFDGLYLCQKEVKVSVSLDNVTLSKASMWSLMVVETMLFTEQSDMLHGLANFQTQVAFFFL